MSLRVPAGCVAGLWGGRSGSPCLDWRAGGVWACRRLGRPGGGGERGEGLASAVVASCDKMVLIRKITLFALAEAIKQSADDDEQMHAMLGVAVELLAMPLNVLVIEAIR